MKSLSVIAIGGALAVLTLGCTNSTVATKRGAVAGSAVGAGVGAIVGSQTGRGLEGAAIGGAVGALGGGTLGSARDEANSGRTADPNTTESTTTTPAPTY